VRYPAYLEIGAKGGVRAWVFALPGVGVRAASAEAALAALPAAIADEFARLERHGRPWPHASQPVEIVEAERVETTADVRGEESRALFEYEMRPTTDADVALALDRLELARLDAVASIDAMRAALGDDGWLAARVRPGDGGAAGEIVRHLADEEVWLLSRLGNAPPSKLPEPALERLDAARAVVVARLGSLIPGDRERHAVFGGEPWTTRKVLRRLTWHAHFHARELEASCRTLQT
jgi:hypothetical protein